MALVKYLPIFTMEQEFTPPYVHHCMGACERTIASIAERLTPDITDSIRTWDKIIFGARPKLSLLSTSHSLDLNNIPGDYPAYMEKNIPHLQ